MLFNSYQFIFIFLPLVLITYHVLVKLKLNNISKVFLVVSSLFFYSFMNIRNLIIILISLGFNFTLYKIMKKYHNKYWLILGVIFNVFYLGVFKYTNFLVDNVNLIFHLDIIIKKIIFPLGISFFTFEQICFLVDTYKKKELYYNLIDYSLFITFFPHLVAGPIVSHAEIIPQVENQSNFNMENFIKGLTLFSIGLFKKVMVADYLGGKVNIIFGDLNSVTMPLAWVGALSYTMQIFLDFSAYSEMAMGIGLMFNIELPFNFLSPYKSSNIKEFWNRWHITLGRFLTNYIYIPLGGNRKGFLRTLINMFIVFLISGVWHGAGYTFIIWGILHGSAMIIHRIWTKLGFKMPNILGWFLTFNFVNIVWIFFRSKDLKSSFIMIGNLFNYSTMYNMESLKLVGGLPYIIILLVVIIFVFTLKNSKVILTSFNNYKYIGLLTGALLCVCLLSLDKVSEFIYFNF